MHDDSAVRELRKQFPALTREQDGRPVVYLDGPAGTQVPAGVIEAVSHYLSTCNANHAGNFLTSQESDRWIDKVHQGVAEFLGVEDSNEVVFGPNMTTLTFHLSRSLAKEWKPGDNVIVTRLDHDANVRPWVLAAEDAGVEVRFVSFQPDDCTLDLEMFSNLLDERTQLVAVGAASNSVGTINPIKDITRRAHEVEALVFVDAVHYAPHQLIDVPNWDCDFLACSAYKFFGPHIGILWGRRQLLESLQPYKLNPAPDSLPGRWMTGTQNHECLVGVLAAVDYLASIGRSGREQDGRRKALECAFEKIHAYEMSLCCRLIEGLQSLGSVQVKGIVDPNRSDERMPTLAFIHSELSSDAVTRQLGEQGIFAWHGNYYAWELSHSLGVEPEGMTRLGIAHYNTMEEIDRLIDAVASLGKRAVSDAN